MISTPLFRILVAAIGAGAMAPYAFAQDGRPDYKPIPPGYGYFEDTDALWQAVEENNRAAVRAHGWGLWAGIMQPYAAGEENAWPVWYSWPTGSQAFPQDMAPPEVQQHSIRKSKHAEKAREMPTESGFPNVSTPAPQYPLPDYVSKNFPGAIKTSKHGTGLYDGAFFASNGDIMIATEAMSPAGYEAILSEKLYEVATLDQMNRDGKSVDFPDEAIFTKHMYWPVKADGVTAVPWYNGHQWDVDFTGYWGYELWDSVVAVDPSGSAEGEAEVSFLYGVLENDGKTPLATRTVNAPVVPIDAFYHHQVTEEDWATYTEADKAILNASSWWLYNEPFGPGDYLVTVAMHVFTKEVPTWTLQSTWWVNAPDAGPYAQDRPDLPDAQGPWQNYLLTQGTQVIPEEGDQLNISVNPYIEGVTHPIGTSCRNCHQRAGHTSPESTGKTGYQTSLCPDLLEALTPESACLANVALTDFSWLTADRAK